MTRGFGLSFKLGWRASPISTFLQPDSAWRGLHRNSRRLTGFRSATTKCLQNLAHSKSSLSPEVAALVMKKAGFPDV